MMKSLAVMQENPELATFNMQIQALEEVLAEEDDAGAGPEHLALAMVANVRAGQ